MILRGGFCCTHEQVIRGPILQAGILGYQAGDEVEWEVPTGIRRFRIVKVDYQPDAANTYHPLE